MKGDTKKLIFSLFVLLISISVIAIVSADSSSTFAQELTCRINFNIGVLNSMMTAFPNSSSTLQPQLTTLQNDLSQIQSFGNNTQVKDFVKNRYMVDMKNVRSAVQSWRKDKKGLTLDQRATLASSYQTLQGNYAQCEQLVSQKISQERIQNYQTQLSVLQNRTNTLSNKGFNVASLNQLLQDAQTQIIQPLQNALSSANSTQSAQMAVKTYCLYDGCVNGINFHLEAKYDLARATVILSPLQANAAAFKLDSSVLSQAQQYLSTAQSTLNSVGTSAYQKGQSQTIFSNIKNGSKLIVQLMTQAMKQPIGGLK